MKAAVLNSFSDKFDIDDIEIGQPLHREVLGEVKACGLCHEAYEDLERGAAARSIITSF